MKKKWHDLLQKVKQNKNKFSINYYFILDEDNDADEYEFSKRQGGHNIIDKQSDCEIKCIYNERNPTSGKGKSVKDAANACKKKCPINKKRDNKKSNLSKKAQPNKKLNLREFIDDDDSVSSEEEQQAQRRELFNYLMEQLQ